MPTLGGPGSVIAAQMAVEDAGGKVLGKPVDIVFADHQNKADVGINIARQWFEVGKVDMAIGFDNSAVALGGRAARRRSQQNRDRGRGRLHGLHRQILHADRSVLDL